MIDQLTKPMNIKQQKCYKLLDKSLENLFYNQEEFDIAEFNLKILEILMNLERKQYQIELDKLGQKDIGNGTYPRNFSCLSDKSLIINVPRTRSGAFSPVLLTLLDNSKETINKLALGLYKKGLSFRDISSLLDEFYGESMSFDRINNIAEEFHHLRTSWESKTLDQSYKIIYLDCQYQSLRRGDSYSKEAIHLIYGVDNNNYRKLLHISVNPTESSSSWEEALNNLKNRGVKNINLAVADGIIGLEDKLFKIFPGIKLQKCITHKKRQILLKTRPKDKREVADDLKEVFDNFKESDNINNAKAKLDNFITKWQNKYPKIAGYFKENIIDYYFTYITYDPNIRRYIYTSNGIENLNRQIRKATKHKSTFEKEARLLDYVFVVIKDFERNNWLKYPVSHFEKIEIKHN
jgi:putative transposase